jgi:endonuclease/exonuclease/phosphatase (EEP) superfamily protein YafD
MTNEIQPSDARERYPQGSILITHHSSLITFLRRILTNLFVALTGAYGLNLTLFLVLRILVGERWAVIGVFNTFAHLMLIPALFLLPLCLLLRRRRLALTQLPAVLAFLFSYGMLFLPRSPAAAANMSAISILTYNLHGDEVIYEPMADLIRTIDADVVAVQELSVVSADHFAESLADLYPYMALHPGDDPTRGQGVLSRLPIASDEYWRTPEYEEFSLGHQRVVLDVNGVPVTLYNTHPVHPAMTGTLFDPVPRAYEIGVILERAAQDSGALVILGDFNMSDQSEDYAHILESYDDTYREIGWGMGFTFPDFSNPRALPRFLSRTSSFPPFVRLDYIFHNDALLALEARVWPISGGSDHRPLFVRLALVS